MTSRSVDFESTASATSATPPEKLPTAQVGREGKRGELSTLPLVALFATIAAGGAELGMQAASLPGFLGLGLKLE